MTAVSTVPYVKGGIGDWEDVYCYTKRGFHPVRVDDEFCDGRYKVVRKLAHGGYSTVWLGEDKRDGRAVALKVCAQGYDGVDREIRMYQHAKQDPNLKNLVVELLDHFNFAGRNGLHACLVFELMWTDVALFVGGQELWTIREIMLKEAIHQGLVILQALADNRIIHNDFRGKNLLITFDDKPLTVKALLALEESSNGKQLRSKLVLEEPESNGGAVIYSQCPVAIIPLGAQVELSKMKIKIADFGCANIIGESPPKLGAYGIMAPEALLGMDLDTSADVWSMGIMTVELFFLERLFSPPYEIGALLSQIIQQFGSMPTKMHEKYVSKLGAKEAPPEPWAVSIHGLLDYPEVLSGAEIRVFCDFLTSMLSMDPMDRVEPSELLAHRWLSNHSRINRNNPCLCGREIAVGVEQVKP